MINKFLIYFFSFQEIFSFKIFSIKSSLNNKFFNKFEKKNNLNMLNE